MSESRVVPLDPFMRITDIQFSEWSWGFVIRRDDGLLYTPACGERLTLRLYAGGGAWLFTGDTAPIGGQLPTAPLPREESVAGLVRTFTHRNGQYVVTFNPERLPLPPGGRIQDFTCVLVTEGERTLKTAFPRGYLEGDAGAPLRPGLWQVTVPYWTVTTTERFPDRVTAERQTTVCASIPYQATFRIRDGNALGCFLFPNLGVVWRPNAQMNGWVGLLQIDNVCAQGNLTIPFQPIQGGSIAFPPTDPEQRIFRLHVDVPLLVALSLCPQGWSATAIEVHTDFGYHGTIPFCLAIGPSFHADHELGEQAPDLLGKRFIRRYRFQWDRDAFLYDTGEGEQRLLRQSATLMQSPPTGFEQWHPQPLAERRG
ncbi:MAG: hypothetical protein H7837_11255 [Magnetococcus sp. MYC-9]